MSNSIDRFTEISLGGKEFEQGGNVEDKTEKGEISQVVEKITNQADQQRLYREAIILHNSGRYEEAEKESMKTIELEPENKEYVNHLDIVLHAMKE